MKRFIFLLLIGIILISCAETKGPDNPDNSKATSVRSQSDGYQCGYYGPNASLRTDSDFGKLMTAFFATPGDQLDADVFIYQPYFFLDEWGAQALMGCYPLTSELSSWDLGNPRTNYFNSYGMLSKQDVFRFVNKELVPATVNYTYTADNPMRVATAEQFCYNMLDTKLARLSFTYKGEKLVSMRVVNDSGCYLNGTYKMDFLYNDPNVPNMPTNIIITEPNQNIKKFYFQYQTYGKRITKIQFNDDSGDNDSVGLSYDAADKLEQMRFLDGTLLDINYNNDQWAGQIDPSYNWGLTIWYNQYNQPYRLLQNTGDPGGAASIFTYLVPNSGWQQISGKLKQVSVGSDGTVWGVNSNDDIWKYTGSGWQRISGKLKHVSVGNSNNIWGVNSNDDIWKYTGSGWQRISGKLKQVSVGSDGAVWGVNSNDDIWKYTGSGWQQISGKLKQVSVGSDGAVWGVNSNDDIWKYTGSGWQRISGKLKHVSVGSDGTVWGVNSNDDIWKYTGSGWQQIPGKLSQVSVGTASDIWGVDSNQLIYRYVWYY